MGAKSCKRCKDHTICRKPCESIEKRLETDEVRQKHHIIYEHQMGHMLALYYEQRINGRYYFSPKFSEKLFTLYDPRG